MGVNTGFPSGGSVSMKRRGSAKKGARGHDFGAGEQVFLGDRDFLHGVGAHAKGNPGLSQFLDGFGLGVVLLGEEAGGPAVGEQDDLAGFAVQGGEVVVDVAEGHHEAGFLGQVHMHQQIIIHGCLLSGGSLSGV